MAKKKEVDVENIEVIDEQVVTEKVVKVKEKKYPLKVSMNIGGVLKRKGEEISLTEKGFRYYKQKNII